MALGAWAETRVPSPALRKTSRLMIPIDIVTGRNRIRTWRTRESCQSRWKEKRNSILRSAQAIISICTTVATSHAIA